MIRKVISDRNKKQDTLGYMRNVSKKMIMIIRIHQGGEEKKVKV